MMDVDEPRDLPSGVADLAAAKAALIHVKGAVAAALSSVDKALRAADTVTDMRGFGAIRDGQKAYYTSSAPGKVYMFLNNLSSDPYLTSMSWVPTDELEKLIDESDKRRISESGKNSLAYPKKTQRTQRPAKKRAKASSKPSKQTALPNGLKKLALSTSSRSSTRKR